MAESETEGYVQALGDKLAKAREGAVRSLAQTSASLPCLP